MRPSWTVTKIPGDTGAPGENIQASGSITRVLALPLLFVLAIALIAFVLKGAQAIHEYVPEFPFSVIALALAAVGSALLSYGALRVADWIR